MSDFLIQHAEDSTIFGDGAMDVVINSSGHVSLIEGNQKLQLELLKACLTGKHTIDEKSYGSNIPKLIGDKQYYAQGNFLQAVVVSSIELSINNYKNQQSSDVPDDETISRIIPGTKARRDAADPTILTVEAAVETISGESVEVQYQIQST